MSSLSEETSGRLRDIFVQELGLDPEEINESLAYGVTPEWDSVGHMHLVAAIEDAFDFAFGDTEISELTSFSQVAKAVASRVG
ncbi:MAG: acyl carrier protein [Paracoccaceae bacterium]